MQHLSPERIASLVDEATAPDERTHLEQCARCRADFVAVRRIVAAAASERERPIAPLLSWQQLSGALQAEGVLAPARAAMITTPAEIRSISSAPSLTAPPREIRVARGWPRMAGLAAAAALLVTVGVAGGRMTAGMSLRGGAGEGVASGSGAAPATSVAAMTPVAQYRSPDDARATLHSAEEVYSGALLWLAAHDSALAPRQPGGSQAAASDYRQRLEVLDAAMATARRALYEAPDDPVMNRYYLATLGAREVTLRRLTTVLPASQQVLEY